MLVRMARVFRGWRGLKFPVTGRVCPCVPRLRDCRCHSWKDKPVITVLRTFQSSLSYLIILPRLRTVSFLFLALVVLVLLRSPFNFIVSVISSIGSCFLYVILIHTTLIHRCYNIPSPTPCFFYPLCICTSPSLFPLFSPVFIFLSSFRIWKLVSAQNSIHLLWHHCFTTCHLYSVHLSIILTQVKLHNQQPFFFYHTRSHFSLTFVFIPQPQRFPLRHSVFAPPFPRRHLSSLSLNTCQSF